MPVGHAPIHELGKAEDTPLITPHLLEQVPQINASARQKSPVFGERQKRLPSQDYPVGEGVHGVIFLGLSEHFRPPAAKFRILVDSEVSIEKRLRCVESLEKLPVP